MVQVVLGLHETVSSQILSVSGPLLPRSAVHDAVALEFLAAHGTASYVDTFFECEGHIQVWQFLVYPALAMLLWVAATLLRLQVTRPKLDKQY